MEKTFEMHALSQRSNRQSSLKAKPATLAIVIQLLALIAVFLSVLVTNVFLAVSFSAFSIVLMQALYATVFCIWAGMATWWRAIHFCFPLALFGMSLWHVPNEIYLLGFLISLSLFWTTFRSQVPFFPSRPDVWQKVAEIIPQDRSIRMIDIGSGLGDLVMHLAKVRADSQFEGIEIAPLPWVISAVRGYFKSSPATFKLGNYHELDFSQYDVIFAYLSPAAMSSLWQKAHHEMRPGCLLISYEFEIVGVKPSVTIAGAKHLPMIYVWKIEQ
jgi:hypothetical protein